MKEEMEEVFGRKLGEKEQKMKETEREMEEKIEQSRDRLDKQRKDLDREKEQFYSEKKVCCKYLNSYRIAFSFMLEMQIIFLI